MAAYRLTPRARVGARNLLEYIEGQLGVGVAERVLDDLATAFDRLADSPGIGHSREDLTSNERIQFWSVGPRETARE